ncbi:MAG: glutamate--tRNA ligase [Gammaproteobacteria bacterium]
MIKLLTKTRFAPSPTGFLHLGNARIALFCALLARRNNGTFLLRIEDTDRERSAAHYTQALQDDLLWMGLDWQEGPGVDGAHGPYLQSERGAVYQQYFDRLGENDQAYPCFCSEQELALSRKAQLSAGQPPRYAGICTSLTKTDVAARLNAGLKPTLRFRVTRGQDVEFTDLVRGAQRFSSDDIGDFIIRRADGTPAFFFTNALDDALMNVTHVLRGEDHLSNTPRQIMLLQALRLRVPAYGHVSLILGTDGAPMSKREGGNSMRGLREAGYFPGTLNNYLAHLGHHYESNAYRDFNGLAEEFDLARIGRAPARFDNGQLLHWQQQAIAQASVDELWHWAGAEVHALVPAENINVFMEAVRPNLSLPQDALRWARIIYTDSLIISPAASEILNATGSAFFMQALQALERHKTDFKALATEIKKTAGVSGKALFQPLRIALTGELDGPEMASLLPLLGITRARERLARWCEK